METEQTTVWTGDGNTNQPSKSFVKMWAVSSTTFSSLHFLISPSPSCIVIGKGQYFEDLASIQESMFSDSI